MKSESEQTFGGVIMRRYRIVNKFRFTASMTLISLIIISALGGLVGAFDASGKEPIDYIEVSVNAGDTLWNIAEYHGPEDVDIREVVYLIAEANDIKNNMIYPGDTLMIPVL